MSAERSGPGLVTGADSQPLIRLVTSLGPGLIAGAADDDPTGIATYAQSGAQTGYGLLWTTLLTLPMLATVQFLATKVAAVRGRGLAGIIRDHYSGKVLYPALLGLIVANVINAGADIGALAAAVNLVVPVPIRVLIIPIALLIVAFLVFGSYRLIERTFKWLTLALVGYIATVFLARPDWLALLRGTFIPQISLNTAFLTLLVATMGGNVSPYLMFWQSDLEVEQLAAEDVLVGRGGTRLKTRALGKELKAIAWDTIIGMLFSNTIIFCIEVSSAETLFRSGNHTVSSAVQAAEALRPLVGNAATTLWAIGIIGSGLLAVPALVGSIADAVAESFSWPEGLNQKPDRAKRFYVVLAMATLAGLGINFLGINPIQALVISAALNGMLAPPLIVLLLLVARRRDVMGDHATGWSLNILGWGTALVMAAAALGLLYTLR